MVIYSSGDNMLAKIKEKLNKRGISATIIGVILLMVGMAIILFLLIYFGKQSETQTTNIVDKLNIIRGGGGLQ